MTTARIRVLYAEDSAADADLTRTHFAEHAPEFDIDVAATGRETLARLAASEHDLLLLDQHLPDMDGIEVLRQVARAGATLPVVLVTGEGDEELVVRALRLGAADYVAKADGYLGELPAVLRSVVREHRARRARALPGAALRRVLYVEHLEMDVELTERHFAEHVPHVELEVAGTFADARARLGRAPALDAALIDLRMPGESGIDFVRECRRRGVEVPPFVVVTGKGDEAAAIACLRLGAADYVVKREGYLDRLPQVLERAIAHDRLERLARRLEAELGVRKRVEADRERWAAAVDQAAETIVITDLAGDILYVNPAFEATTGWTRSEVVGRNARVLKADHAQDPQLYRTMWETIARGEVWHGRFANRKRSGEPLTEEATISPVRDAGGAIVGYVAVMRDITRDLELQAQLLQSQRMEAIGRLAGGVAHDFNNLLSVIISYTELALDQAPPGSQLRDDLQEAQHAAERASAMTRQLLAFSRKQVLLPVPLDLNEVVRGLHKMLRRILGEDVDLVLALAPDLGVVRADPGQMEQIIVNLAVNARDAMPTGGRLRIETSDLDLDAPAARGRVTLEPRRWVRLAVADTGSGIDEAVRARLFEPFFTTKEPGKGTGLGLSTVYGIVRQSGGQIAVASEPGRGATFEVFLPREAAAAPVTVRPAPAPTRRAGSETILVVEDEEPLRKVSRRSLEAAGYEVLSAGDGAEALAIAASHRGEIHLLFTDVVMPRMSGRALAEALAKIRPGARVLFTSGYADDTIVHHGVVDPSTPFLAKPYTAVELARKVREVLDAAPPGG